MFFILSKVLQFAIKPMCWIVFLIILSLFTKHKKRRRLYAIISIAILIFTTNSFIVDEFMRKWEVKAIKYEKLDEPYDYGIVLCGMMLYDKKMERINFYKGADRLLQAIDLYHRGYIKKIVLSGGSGIITIPDMIESKYLNDYLVTIGIPQKDIIIETESRNTHENAVNTVALLTDHHEKSCLLITSAFHMKRAMGCFEKQGLIATPFVTDRYSGPRKFQVEHLLMPDERAMAVWSLLIHEIAGYMFYALMGYL